MGRVAAKALTAKQVEKEFTPGYHADGPNTGLYRPNKASWFAVTWLPLDKILGYDPGAEQGFIRSAYLK